MSPKALAEPILPSRAAGIAVVSRRSPASESTRIYGKTVVSKKMFREFCLRSNRHNELSDRRELGRPMLRGFSIDGSSTMGSCHNGVRGRSRGRDTPGTGVR